MSALYDIKGYLSHCFNEENRIPTTDELDERFAMDLTLEESEMLDEIVLDFVELHDMEGINNEWERQNKSLGIEISQIRKPYVIYNDFEY